MNINASCLTKARAGVKSRFSAIFGGKCKLDCKSSRFRPMGLTRISDESSLLPAGEVAATSLFMKPVLLP
jgi:hypothetical protein